MLSTQLEKAGNYKVATTTGLCFHKWRPVQFVLIVDDFCIEYVRKQHALHLLKILEQHYEITADWEGKKFAGIYLACNYDEQHSNRTCRISMNGYIYQLLMKYVHPQPHKPQLSLHKLLGKHWWATSVGAHFQCSPESDLDFHVEPKKFHEAVCQASSHSLGTPPFSHMYISTI